MPDQTHTIRPQDELVSAVEKGKGFFPKLNEASKVEDMARLFKALGDGTRLKIISFLSVQASCLCEIVDALGIPTSTVNHHLKLLMAGNIISSEKRGKFTVYDLNDKHDNLVNAALFIMRDGM